MTPDIDATAQPGHSPRVTRRAALTTAAAAGLAAASIGVHAATRAEPSPTAPTAYDGRHQHGIRTAAPNHLTLAAFDLRSPDPSDLPRLLRDWTTIVEALPGSGCTVTVGFGAPLFDGRFGPSRRPVGLVDAALGHDDGLDRDRSDGDLIVQVCGDDRQVVFDAVHRLANAALGIAARRWTQQGFLPQFREGGTPRNLLGFRDGTANLATNHDAALERHVWVPGDDSLAGGTYLAYRRIRLRLQAWDRTPVAAQEQTIGRRKDSGGPLAGGPARVIATDEAPRGSHVRTVHPGSNGGIALLRRSYNYDDGTTADGTTDAGMAFVCFAANPQKQLGQLLTRMEQEDQMERYLEHTATGLFAVPPAPAPGEFIGQGLLG